MMTQMDRRYLAATVADFKGKTESCALFRPEAGGGRKEAR